MPHILGGRPSGGGNHRVLMASDLRKYAILEVRTLSTSPDERIATMTWDAYRRGKTIVTDVLASADAEAAMTLDAALDGVPGDRDV